MRQKFRETIISATPQKLRNVLAEYFTHTIGTKAVAVLSSPEKINEANKRLTEKLLIENI